MIFHLSLVFSIVLYYVESCSLLNTFEIVTTFESVLQCTSINSHEFSDISSTIDLKGCLSQHDRENCDLIINDFLQNKSTSIVKELGSKLLASPVATCSCLEDLDSKSDGCVPVVDQFASYCKTFEAKVVPELISKNSTSESSIHSRCSDSVEKVCQLKDPSFGDIITCITSNMDELRQDCINVIDSMLVTVYGACYYEIFTTCQSTNPLDVLPCLISEKKSLGSSCRAVVDTFVSSDYPCEEEAGKYCSSHHTVSSVLSCLEENSNANKLGAECSAMITGLNNCREMSKNGGDPFKPVNNGGEGWIPGGKSKPVPGDEKNGQSNKPKPGGDSKPVPGDKPAPMETGSNRGGKPAPEKANSNGGGPKKGPPMRSRTLITEENDVQFTSGYLNDGSQGELELPCWAQQSVSQKQQKQQRNSKGSSSSSSNSQSSELNSDNTAFSNYQSENLVDTSQKSAFVGFLTGLGVVVMFLMVLVGVAWYRNGMSFRGLSQSVQAISRGYGRAPSSAADIDYAVELESRSTATAIVMAQAYCEK